MKLTTQQAQTEDDYWRIRSFLREVFLPNNRHDPDIVASASNGDIAASCTIYYDDYTRIAVSLLVGTAAEHWRRGLGKAVLTEGMRRLQGMGCTRLLANGYDSPAHALYGSVLGTKEDSETRLKEL